MQKVLFSDPNMAMDMIIWYDEEKSVDDYTTCEVNLDLQSLLVLFVNL